MASVVPNPDLFPRADKSGGNCAVESCSAHEHLCLIYDGREEQLAAVVPFLHAGLQRGEKCLYVVDENVPETIVAALRRSGMDADAAMDSGALTIVTKWDAYLKNGEFDPDWMVRFLDEAINRAEAEGYTAFRVSGETTWTLGRGQEIFKRLMEYECKVNELFRDRNVLAICQYNRRRFRPETLLQVIHTHPLLVCGNLVCENPHYIPPEVFDTNHGDPASEVQRLLDSIVQNARLKEHLAAETRALRETADRQERAEATLRKSEKFAAAGRMAATIAHEINNPLEAMVNLWYLLGQEAMSPEGQLQLKMLGDELSRVSHITKQTLEFYREGKTAGPLNLMWAIEAAIGLFSRKAEARRAKIETDCRISATLFGFAGELRQVFANLIDNSLEAGASQVKIRISPAHRWAEPMRVGVRVTLSDNGPGVAADAAGKLFEPFFTTKEEKGTGLGLWVSKGIVQKHDGSIQMRSSTKPGRRGTTFSLFLPTLSSVPASSDVA